MLEIELTQVKARCWRGYTENKTGWLPRRMSWMALDAAVGFAAMNDACGHLIEYTNVYRSVLYQIQSIRGANEAKKRLYAPPTKSGHNFGFSVDVEIDCTLENFRRSKNPELIAAGRERNSLARWMTKFGWTGIKTERWHFNFLGDHESTVNKIDAVYGQAMELSNDDVQRALNILLKPSVPLIVDGVLGPKSDAAAKQADTILSLNDRGAFSPWFRRVLAGATATIREV